MKENYGISPVVILWAIFAILFLVMCIGLYFEERYLEAIGMFILAGVLLFYILLATVNLEKYRINKMAKIIKGKRKKQSGNLQIVFTSKDRLMIVHVEERLKEKGIKCFVFDEQANSMMSFIDGIEMRVLVYKEDYEKSISIIDAIEKNE